MADPDTTNSTPELRPDASARHERHGGAIPSVVREVTELTRMRILLFLREPEAIFWVFVFPIILFVVLGFAFRETVPGASVLGVIKGSDVVAEARALERAGELEVKVVADRDEALRALRRGAIDVLIEPGDPPSLRFDPQREPAVLAKVRVENLMNAAAATEDAERIEAVPQTERGSRYIDFLFAGIIGLNIMGTSIWGIGFAIADIRQKKLLKRLIVTPMRRSSLLIAFILSRFVFMVLELGLLLVFGLLILDVPMQGNLVAFILIALLGALSFSGLGLLVASRARTTEGVSGIMNFVMMPMWLASGVFFPYERFPEVTHVVLKLLPLTALNDALRNIMIDGETLMAQGVEVAILTVWMVVSFAVTLKIFRWQ